MAEGYKSYRIRTKVGQDAPNVVNVHLDQTYDEFQILSLKIDQKNSYNLYQSDKGIVVGRVLANGGVGVANAKISIFIPTDDTMGLDKHIIYPYSSVNDTNGDRIRYNLLPDHVDEVCHQDVGTFPNKRYVLDNDDVIEIFDRFWKYTTVTNSSGDYMLYGIPTGSQTLHMDVDMSDIGFLNQKPRDLSYKGYDINLFESPVKFKQDTNLNSLAQIKSQDIGIYVYPFWGDSTDNPDNIAVTRCDIQIDYKFEPTCVFIGSIITDTGSNAIGKNCAGTDNVGKMSDLVAGEGSIEMIRKTIDNKVEEFQIKGNRVIDGDGVWCYQIPMNLDYVMTDEFGNLVPTDNPDKGIATRARVRFRISLDETPSDNEARKRCKYLVPNNPRIDAERFPEFTADPTHTPDYEFGTNTREESYCDLFWNKVYTVKNYIPRIQKNTKITNRKHTGIKLINHYGDNNPMPYNNLGIKLSFTYRFICVLTKIFILLVGFINNLLSIIGAIPCKIADFFNQIADFFNFSIFGVRPLGTVARLFRSVAKVFYSLVPPCIAISSEFCADNVTHAYTFYPGCGRKGIAQVIGALADCVWEKTQDNHYDDMKGKKQEDKTEPTNNSTELYNCVEEQLAEDNDATSFNFHNDWINGTLYSPMWFRKITPKKKFLFGLFSRSAKDEWCSADHAYNGFVRIFQPCAVARNGNTTYSNHNSVSTSAKFMASKPECSDDCHEKTSIIGLNYGVIRSKETMLGQTVYYYKPVEYEKNASTISGYEGIIEVNVPTGDKLNTDKDVDGTLKLLFATDIVLLGSLNDCDLNGVPQFFKSLESTTFKIPPNMLFTDNNMVQAFNEDGTLSTKYDQVSTSEMTGNDWGNSNDDMCGSAEDGDGGLFYDIGCSSIEMRPKSCINLSRICEFGVSLDETKQVPDLSQLSNSGDTAFETLVPDGFISKDELYNDNERSMFATMNGNELITKLNTENGLKEYDFRHLYVDNFDKSLYDAMKLRQKKCDDTITYRYNYNLEEFSAAYYDFRMGKNPFFYDSANKFPRYENSFYFYFGLKAGKTAIDKFNSQFFAECHNPEEAVSPVRIDLQPNTWCSETTTDEEGKIDSGNDGYVKIDLSKVALPCDILIRNKNSDDEFFLQDVEDDKIVLTNKTEYITDGYVQKCEKREGKTRCSLDNGRYELTITDADGEIISLNFELLYPYLKYIALPTNFKQPDNVLLGKYSDSSFPRIGIAEDREEIGSEEYPYTRKIGGTIAIYDIFDGLTDDEINNFTINVKSINKIEGIDVSPTYFETTLQVDNGSTSVNKYIKYIQDKKLFIICVPKGDERYNITIRQRCNGADSQNKLSQTVYVGDMTPYKLYINNTVDYDVIKHWGCGYELKQHTENLVMNKVELSKDSETHETTYFNLNKFSENWLNISDYDGKDNNNVYRYKWDELIAYNKCIDKINKLLENGKSNNYFPLTDIASFTSKIYGISSNKNIAKKQITYDNNQIDVPYLYGIIENTSLVYEEEIVYGYYHLGRFYKYHDEYYYPDEAEVEPNENCIYIEKDDNGVIIGIYKYGLGQLYEYSNEPDRLIPYLQNVITKLEIGDDAGSVAVLDAIDIMEGIINECNNIIEVKADFITAMKSAFWLTCANEEKNIDFRATTDDMPVAFYIAHRSEVAADTSDTNILEYNEKGKLTYTFNEGRRIDDVTIPTITIKDSDRFGVSKIMDSDNVKKYFIYSENSQQYVDYPDVTLALDNNSSYPIQNRQKYAFFVGVINSFEQAVDRMSDNELIPNGVTIPVGIKGDTWKQPNVDKLFGFHVIDKILEVKYVSWAYMNDIPYFEPKTTIVRGGQTLVVPDKAKNGNTVRMNGLFAGRIYNGAAKSVDNSGETEFETQTVGKFKMKIKTLNSEDAMPTRRYIYKSNAPDEIELKTNPPLTDADIEALPTSDELEMVSYQNWRDYRVEDNNAIERHYVPLLPANVTMEIEDSTNCVVSEEILGKMSIAIMDDSIDDCRDRKKNVFHVSAQGADDDVIYFLYQIDDDKMAYYPLNKIDERKVRDSYYKVVDEEGVVTGTGYRNDIFDVFNRATFEIDPISKFGNGRSQQSNDENGQPEYLFSYGTEVEDLVSNAVEGFGTEILDSNGEGITVCDYFKLEKNDDYNKKSISSTGLFKGSITLVRLGVKFSVDREYRGNYFVVARTPNNCCAISPVYTFVDIKASVVLGKVETKVEKSSGGGEGGGGDSGGGSSSSVETITTNAVGFYIVNAAPNYLLDKDLYPVNEPNKKFCWTPPSNEYDAETIVMDGVYYLNYFEYELHALCEVDPVHVVEDSAMISPSNNSCDINPLFINIDDDMYETLEGYIQNERAEKERPIAIVGSVGQVMRTALANVTTVEVRDVTGLRHNACISARNLDMYRDAWVAITYRPNGGYWPNKSDEDDKSDTAVKTKFISKNWKKKYEICEFFGEPKAVDKNVKFVGWYEIEDPDTIIKCTDDNNNPIIINDGPKPKIYVAIWRGPTSIIWDANGELGGYFGTPGNTQYTQNLEDNQIGQYVNWYSNPQNTGENKTFDGWECIDNCQFVVIDTTNRKVKTQYTCTLKAKWVIRHNILWV